MHAIRHLIGRMRRTCLSFGRLAQSFHSDAKPRSVVGGAGLKNTPSCTRLLSTRADLDDERAVEHELLPTGEHRRGVKEAREAHLVVEDYQQLRSQGALSADQYHKVLAELAEGRRFAEAGAILDDMKAAGLVDAAAYSYAVMSARPSLLFQELRFLFGEPLEGRNDDLGTDNDPKVSENFIAVCKLLEEMKGRQLALDSFFYDDLINSLASGKQAGIMINICMTMEKRGLTPSIYFYNQLLMTLPKKGYMQRASALYDRLVVRGQANRQTHLIRLQWLAFAGRLDDAVEAFKDIGERFHIDRVAYNILISGYLKAGRGKPAFKLYGEMKTHPDAECRPDRVTCSAFLSHFYSTGDLDGASTIMADLSTWGYPRTVRDYSLLIRLNARFDPTEAVRIFKEVVSKDLIGPLMCNDMIRIVIDRRVMNECKVTLVDALVEACKVDSLPLDGLLPGLLPEKSPLYANSSQSRNMVREVLALMEAKGWGPTIFTVEFILRRMITWSDTSKLHPYLDYLKNNDITATWNIRNSLVQAYIIAGDKDAACAELKNLVYARIPLSPQTIDALTSADIPIPSNHRRFGTDADSGDVMERPSGPRSTYRADGNTTASGNHVRSNSIPIGI